MTLRLLLLLIFTAGCVAMRGEPPRTVDVNFVDVTVVAAPPDTS